MIEEYSVKKALSLYPAIRIYIPKEIIAEMITDEKYICRLKLDQNKKIELIEFGYEDDPEWKLH